MYRVIILSDNYRLSYKIITPDPRADVYQPLREQQCDILHLAQSSIIAKTDQFGVVVML